MQEVILKSAQVHLQSLCIFKQFSKDDKCWSGHNWLATYMSHKLQDYLFTLDKTLKTRTTGIYKNNLSPFLVLK